jgi:hypothetical chaperone protein
LLKYFGEGKVYGDGLRLPPPIFEALLSWPRHPDLSRGHFYHRIWEAVRSGSDTAEFKALLQLIDRKHGYRLFEQIEKTKIQLSEREEAIFSFHMDEIDIDEPITQKDFRRCIADDIDHIEAGVGSVMRKGNLIPQEVDLVLCTGGSSQIPVILNGLVQRFGAQKIRQHDPFLAVTRGLAVAASTI